MAKANRKGSYVVNPQGKIVNISVAGDPAKTKDILAETIGKTPPYTSVDPETGEVSYSGGWRFATDEEIDAHVKAEKEAAAARKERIMARRKENAAIVINQVSEKK